MQLDPKENLSKIEIRRTVLQDLKALTLADRTEKSDRIQEQLKKHLAGKTGCWTAFIAMASEPQIDWSQVSETIQWCFPKVQKQGMEFSKAPASFRKNPLGFIEPVGGENVSQDQIAGCIIPGVAFDSQGHRLGRGRGFYDRALHNFNGSVIGVCFHRALVNHVPTEVHDVKCQHIITEEISVVIEGIKSWK